MPAPSPMDTDTHPDSWLAPATPARPPVPAGRGRRRARPGGAAPAAPAERAADIAPTAHEGPAPDPGGEVVRWAVFCCVLVPVVLLVYGTSLGGAAGTALGLLAVTAVCRVLLRRSERGLRAEHHSRS